MNIESTSNTQLQEATEVANIANNILSGEEAEASLSRSALLERMIKKIKQSHLVPVGTTINNYDKNPKKRMISIAPFNQTEEWFGFLSSSPYGVASYMIEDPIMYPIFHLKFQERLREKGLIADYDAGYALLVSQGQVETDAEVVTKNRGTKIAAELQQPTGVADAPKATRAEVAAVADDIVRDFEAVKSEG